MNKQTIYIAPKSKHESRCTTAMERIQGKWSKYVITQFDYDAKTQWTNAATQNPRKNSPASEMRAMTAVSAPLEFYNVKTRN